MSRVLALFLVLEAVLTASAGDQAKAEAQAKEAAAQYVKALKTKDLDGLLKIADVPWLDDGKRVIKDKAELKKHLKERIDGVAEPDQVPSEILSVHRFATLRNQVNDKKFLAMADEVLGQDGLVVMVGRNGSVYNSNFVKITAGKAKVVGFAR